jgi:hypothetical protein
MNRVSPRCSRSSWIQSQGVKGNKESGPKGPDFGLPPEGASIVFPLLRQSAGVMKHSKILNKHQISGFSVQVSVFRFQCSGFRFCVFFLTPDTRHLKPPQKLAIFTGKAIEL